MCPCTSPAACTARTPRAAPSGRPNAVAARLEEDVPSRALVEPTAATLGTYLEQWLETHVRLHNASRTCQDYRNHVERFLQPRLGPSKAHPAVPAAPARSLIRPAPAGPHTDGGLCTPSGTQGPN